MTFHWTCVQLSFSNIVYVFICTDETLPTWRIFFCCCGGNWLSEPATTAGSGGWCNARTKYTIQLKQIHITPPSQWPPSIKCEHLPYNLVRIANKMWKYHWDGLINTLNKNIFKNDHLQQSTHLQSDTETSCHNVYQIYAHHFTVFLNLKSDCTLNSLEPT